ncbi:MAG: hypothetical protein IJ583_02300 [Firmicutes bacterium]|nr:hypothetical protein [Bacillota bacterium]
MLAKIFSSAQTTTDYVSVKNLPILILDHEWNSFFPNSEKTPEIKACESKLKELMKEQGNLNNKYKQLGGSKKVTLDKLLTLSNDVRERKEGASKATLEKKKNEVTNINNDLAAIEARLDKLPSLIEQENNRLFQECIKYTYNNVSKLKKEAQKLDPVISKLSKQLKEETAKKNAIESKFKLSAEFLESYIGREGIASLDKKYKGKI